MAELRARSELERQITLRVVDDLWLTICLDWRTSARVFPGNPSPGSWLFRRQATGATRYSHFCDRSTSVPEFEAAITRGNRAGGWPIAEASAGVNLGDRRAV